MTPKLEIVYFNSKGSAETARMMLAFGKVEYTDTRIARENWPALKPSTPFGQVPILKVDGVSIAQSSAINRYVAGLVGLVGDSPIEAAKSDMIVASVADLFAPMRAIMMEQDETKKAELKVNLGKDQLVPWLKIVGDMLGDKKFFLGDKPSLADFVVASFMPMFGEWGGQADNIAAQKNIADLVTRAEALPGVKEWIEKRPKE